MSNSSEVRGAHLDKSMTWRVAASLIVLLLTGCGFQLQGDIQLPQAVRVIELQVTDRQSEFASLLARRLSDAGVEVRWALLPVTVVAQDSSSVARLQIEQDEFIERIASVSARNVPREYELTYRVQYSFRPTLAQTASAIEAEELALSREFSFNERAVLAKQREREQLRSTLANELAGMVIQRIASVK